MTRADRYHFDGEAWARDFDAGIRTAYSNDSGEYHCGQCGAAWRAGEVWRWWPLTLRWSPRPNGSHRLLSVHGVQVGFDGIERRVFARVIRLGPLILRMGPVSP